MVSLEHYKCFCETRVKSRDGRGFFKCKEETCSLFIPEEKYPSLMVCYDTKVNQCYKPNKFPLCHCNEMCSLWVSNSETNPGRGYFRCQENDEDQKINVVISNDPIKSKGHRRNATVTTSPLAAKWRRSTHRHTSFSAATETLLQIL